MYVKLFADILFSSIWQEDDKTRIVWITLLVMADQDGMVEATAPGISHAARIDYPSTIDALERLQSADPDSRTEAHDGRRIERTDGGYIILNYRKYREMHNKQQKREQAKERARRYRARKKALEEAKEAVTVTDVTKVTRKSRPVTRRHAKSRQAEAEAEAEAEAPPLKGGRNEEISEAQDLVNQFAFSFPKSYHAKDARHEKCLEHFEVALARGVKAKHVRGEMARLVEAGNLAPTPWEICAPLDPQRPQVGSETKAHRSERHKKLQKEYEDMLKRREQEEKEWTGTAS